ncbi:10225_t:CDS:2 [Diversispora eburnea]|uniref:10225_t:CDS:1 n=1 Tax=Diversispora eburnea TaxID=1213867 RepID=A0A9N8Z477_9GLOM|nr:10225_t:CDS:2 [Diversispora eburnea]
MVHNATQFSASYPNHNTLALIVHVSAWILQFLGHGFAEKRSPALKESLIQALLTAPLFVWMEVLFGLGYRPELQKRIKTKVNAALAIYKRKNLS